MIIKVFDDQTSCTNWTSGVVPSDIPKNQLIDSALASIRSKLMSKSNEEVVEFLIGSIYDFGVEEYEYGTCEQCGHMPSYSYWEFPLINKEDINED